jgi:hypothetical protein
MDLRRNVLEHQHHPVAADDGPKVIAVSITTLVQDVEPELGLVELQGSAQIVNNKKGRNTVQHAESAPESNT